MGVAKNVIKKREFLFFLNRSLLNHLQPNYQKQ